MENSNGFHREGHTCTHTHTCNASTTRNTLTHTHTTKKKKYYLNGMILLLCEFLICMRVSRIFWTWNFPLLVLLSSSFWFDFIMFRRAVGVDYNLCSTVLYSFNFSFDYFFWFFWIISSTYVPSRRRRCVDWSNSKPIETHHPFLLRVAWLVLTFIFDDCVRSTRHFKSSIIFLSRLLY
jgi:hypothetical protein